MMHHVIPAVEALWADERGALVGLLAGAEIGAVGDASARLAGVVGVRCRAALDALGGLPEDERRAEREALRAAVGAPVPEGLEEVHPGWLRRALEVESSAVIRSVVAGLPGPVGDVADEILKTRGASSSGPSPEGPALEGLRRAVFAGLAPVARGSRPVPSQDEQEELDRRGAETLGLALVGAPADVVARAAASVPGPLARVVLASARDGRPEQRGAARALVGSVPPGEAARGVARAVGLRAAARDLADATPAARAAMAQRLAPPVGDALLALAGAARAEGP